MPKPRHDVIRITQSNIAEESGFLDVIQVLLRHRPLLMDPIEEYRLFRSATRRLRVIKDEGIFQFCARMRTEIAAEDSAEGPSNYASCPDRAIDYSREQERWKAFSVEVMNQIIFYLLSSNFEAIYRLAANRRAEIAKELKHGDGFWFVRAHLFGAFRKEGSRTREIIVGDPMLQLKFQAWKKMGRHIFQTVISLVSNIPVQEYRTYPDGTKTYSSTCMYVTRKVNIVTEQEITSHLWSQFKMRNMEDWLKKLTENNTSLTATKKEKVKSEDDCITYMIQIKSPKLKSRETNHNVYDIYLSLIE